MKVYLIVLLLIAPSLGRPGKPTQDDEGVKSPTEQTAQVKTPELIEMGKSAAALPSNKDDLRIHQEIADTILKSRTDPKNQGQNVVISARVSVNTQPQNSTIAAVPAPPKFSSTTKNDDHPKAVVNHGIAVPLTMEEIEKEMELANKKPHDSSTQKEGISTWILLNGSDPTVQPELKSSQYRAEIDKKVDKIARIKEGQINKQTVDITNAINKRNEAKLKQRPKPTTTTTTTTTTISPDELLPVYDEEDYEEEDSGEMPVEPVVTVKPPTKSTTKAPVNKKPQNNKQNPKPTTTTTTTELTPTESTRKPETTTFLIMEPKDAGFDMPQDRSPTGNAAGKKKKRPAVTNKNNNADKKKKKNENKKKPAVDSDIEVKNSTKAVNAKLPQKNNVKPISTQIYNYLAREVMPTVGVGLVGLVVAGGLASYLLGGPFGALRRSYDIQDRKDDIYHFNNEEYAGQSDGQNEEDMFGKVIAGMPSQSLYRNNIRYQSSPYRSNPNQLYQQPGPQMHPAYSKYGPYNSRYRYNSGYRPGAPLSTGSGYPAPPPPQYQQSGQQQTYPQSQYRYSSSGSGSNQQPSDNIKTVYAQSQPSSSVMGQVSPVYSADRSDGILEQTQSSGYSVSGGGTMDNQLQHRSQFVVGSTVPADAPMATEKEVQTEETEVEGSTVITVPEHGPRRKRATDGEDRKISSKKINDNEIDNENDLDSNLYYKYDVKAGTEPITDSAPTVVDSVTPEVVMSTETVTSYPGQGTPFFDFFRRVIELKVRYGLSFLQNTTNAFQRYLSGVQERVNSSPIFNPKY